LLTDLGGESKGKNHEGFMHTPPPNPKEKGLEITPRKSPRKGSENHQKERTGTTHPSLDEPYRIIYTSQRDIHGLASARSSYPLTRSHHEALKLVLEILREKEEENSKTK
jgi:hypothetical protein